MAAVPELDKDEQALFEQMREGKGPDSATEEAVAAAKAATEAAAKEAAEKAAKDATDKPKPDEKMLPAAAVAEARKENKELKKELEAMKNLVSEGDKKLQKFIDSVSKKAEEGPKYEEDAAGHLKHENEQLKKAVAEVNERLARQDAAAQHGNKLTEFAATVSAAEKAFAKENADYYQATEFVSAIWRDEFTEAGYKEADITKMVFNKALAITHQAVQAERDPAVAIYKIATRYGFKKPAAEDKKDLPKQDGESKLKTIEKGMDAAKAAGGGSGPDELTLTTLSQMSDADIERAVADKDWWSKNIKRSPLH